LEAGGFYSFEKGGVCVGGELQHLGDCPSGTVLGKSQTENRKTWTVKKGVSFIKNESEKKKEIRFLVEIGRGPSPEKNLPRKGLKAQGEGLKRLFFHTKKNVKEREEKKRRREPR